MNGSRRKCKFRAGSGAESEWSDKALVHGNRLTERVFGSRGESIKEGLDKGRLSLCRLRGGEGGRRGLYELGLQTLAGKVTGCQWKGRKGFVGCHGGVSVEEFPQTPSPRGRYGGGRP